MIHNLTRPKQQQEPRDPEIINYEEKLMYKEDVEEEIVLVAGKLNQDISKTIPNNISKVSGVCKVIQPTPPPIPISATPAALPATKRTFPENLVSWSSPVDVSDLMDEISALFHKHCVLTKEEIDAAALWILSSYMINSFRIFPKLTLISPSKRCGKSTTMEVIQALCRDGLMTSNLSAATIYRLTVKYSPSLLIDEADTFLKSGDDSLIGIVNSGHSQASAMVLRCDGDKIEPKAFSTWMPMVLASIGRLASTIMDRSIVLNLRRKKRSEVVQRLPADLLESCEEIRRKLLRWSLDYQQVVKHCPIEPPEIGNDRATDNWLALFSVAHQINSSWEVRCKNAYEELTEILEPDLQEELLRDIQEFFHNNSETRTTSQYLVDALISKPECVWAQMDNGKQLTPRTMSRILAPYKIKPKVLRFPTGTLRGYEAQQFEDSFDRYL